MFSKIMFTSDYNLIILFKSTVGKTYLYKM